MVTEPEFKTILQEALDAVQRIKHYKILPAKQFVGQLVGVRAPQVHRWLKGKGPFNMEERATRLRQFTEELKNNPNAGLPNAVPSYEAVPFEMTIPKDKLKLTRDNMGNILVEGLFYFRLK